MVRRIFTPVFHRVGERKSIFVVAHALVSLQPTLMPKRIRPTLNVTVDAHIRKELDRLKRECSVNISDYVNKLLRPHFKKGKK